MSKERLVYIVDDDDAVRRSANFMLSRSGYDTEPIVSGAAFMQIAKEARPGCVLLDVRMPYMNGLEVQENMKNSGIDMPIVMQTGSGDIETAVQAMRAGALSFLEKPYEKEKLITAIEDAFQWLENDDRKVMASSEAKVRLACLTGREQDVLGAMMAGSANKAIAQGLGISNRTVEICRANIMEKLSVRNIAEALRIGFAAEAEEKANPKPL